MKKTIYSVEYAAFRAMLRETRERLNLSQDELGKKLGMHQPFIARIESGQRRLDVVEFINMMKTMGVSSVGFLKKLEAKIEKSDRELSSRGEDFGSAFRSSPEKSQSKSSETRTRD